MGVYDGKGRFSTPITIQNIVSRRVKRHFEGVFCERCAMALVFSSVGMGDHYLLGVRGQDSVKRMA